MQRSSSAVCARAFSANTRAGSAAASKKTVVPLVTGAGGACLGLGLWTTSGNTTDVAAARTRVRPPPALARLRSVQRQLASFLLSDDLHHSIGVNILE